MLKIAKYEIQTFYFHSCLFNLDQVLKIAKYEIQTSVIIFQIVFLIPDKFRAYFPRYAWADAMHKQEPSSDP